MSRRYSPFAAAALAGGTVAMTLLAGCANLDSVVNDVLDNRNRGPRTVAYECDDDRSFRARYSGDRDEVSVQARGETYRLELVDRDGDRRVYGEDDDDDDDDDNVRLTVWGGDRGAYLRIPDGNNFEDCEAEF